MIEGQNNQRRAIEGESVGDMRLLDFKFQSGDLDKEVTVAEWLRAILRALVIEGEVFSAKRPLDNDGWHCDLQVALVKSGAIDGQVDEYDYLEWVNHGQYEDLLLAAIEDFK